jgi:23S rRNA G2069 N7-methylase RlmK/C1962 C5-methylase RlmI
VGLFLDQRDNRKRVRDLSAGKEVLNLFAYTCGFSVAAAAGGARSTTSVDLSPSHLEWGRRNFALNHLDPAGHEFIPSDAAEFLRRALRQNRSFDLVILDAPTFAHGRKRGKSFSITRDLPELVCGVLAVLAPGGIIMVSTNNRRLSLKRLKGMIARGVKASGAGQGAERSVSDLRIINAPSLPLDFAVDRDHAKTLFVSISRPTGTRSIEPPAA